MGTLKEAAALAGIPYSAIRKMCITGKVVHVRVGTKYLVNLDKLAEYLIQKETITGKEFMEIFNREYHGADAGETPAIVVDAEKDAYVSGVKLDTDADTAPIETGHDNEAETAEQGADASEEE